MLFDPNGVVVDISQVAVLLVVDPGLVHQPREDPFEGARRALELDDLSGQLVYPARDRGARGEDLVLDLVDVSLQAGHDRLVAVNDVVDDRVHDRQRAAAEQIRPRLEAPPHGPQLRRVAVADGDHELGANEDRDLTEQDSLRLVNVAGRSQDEEQGVAIAFELGALMRLDCVLDREIVQAELARDRGEFLAARFVQAQPGNGAFALTGVVQLGEVIGLPDTTAVAINRVVDDHARSIALPPTPDWLGRYERNARDSSSERIRRRR